MSARRSEKSLLVTIALATMTVLAAPAAQAVNATETMVKMYSGPDEYYFFEADKKKVVDYKQEHTVRICTGDSRHLVPLKVTYDGETAMIHANDCIRVEAKEVYLEPAKPLDPSWSIHADVDTLG